MTKTQRCEAHITKNRGRLKEFKESTKGGGFPFERPTVFLNDGETFEIELFNPLQTNVLAKIWINGNLINESGIIIRPGQRQFLERFLSEDRKFLFETYNIEDTKESRSATIYNGEVKILFYKEKLLQNYYVFNPFYTSIYTPFYTPSEKTWTGNIPSEKTWTGDFFSNTSNSNNSISNIGANCSATLEDSFPVFASIETSHIETGRIEKGEASGQTFVFVNMDFEDTSFCEVKWKILPFSQKPVEISDLRKYCPSCRTRIRKASWKYCPSCGSDLD